MEVRDEPGYRFADRFRNGAQFGGLDALVIGESTTSEHAAAALQFATNHGLVFTTLTAPDAATGFERFQSMAGETIETPVLVINQVLLKRLCEECREQIAQQPAGTDRPRGFRAVGCPECDDGYKGRCGVFEAYLYEGDALRRMGRSLADNAARKVAAGITDYEELKRLAP